jgi:hypothetical protein
MEDISRHFASWLRIYARELSSFYVVLFSVFTTHLVIGGQEVVIPIKLHWPAFTLASLINAYSTPTLEQRPMTGHNEGHVARTDVLEDRACRYQGRVDRGQPGLTFQTNAVPVRASAHLRLSERLYRTDTPNSNLGSGQATGHSNWQRLPHLLCFSNMDLRQPYLSGIPSM